MNREDYKLYTWYPLTDDEYWVDVGVLQELFPDCKTIVCDIDNHIMTYNDCHIGWGTMAKRGTFKFAIIETKYLKMIDTMSMDSKITEMIENRQQANRDIISHLSILVESHPKLRFGQILAMLDIIQYKTVNKIGGLGSHVIEPVDPFHEEPVITLQRVENKVKQIRNQK